MGRSTSYLHNAAHVVYLDTTTIQESFEWEDLIDNIKSSLSHRFPSLFGANSWDDRETQIILENNFAQIGFSEYGGLTSLSIRVTPDYERESIAENWIEKTWSNILDTLKDLGYPLLAKEGSLSNGEGVFQQITGKSRRICHNGSGITYEQQ